MRAKRCSPYPELFRQPDESKRAEKMLELAIHNRMREKKAEKMLELAYPKSFRFE
jgi:hypothetical protein